MDMETPRVEKPRAISISDLASVHDMPFKAKRRHWEDGAWVEFHTKAVNEKGLTVFFGFNQLGAPVHFTGNDIENWETYSAPP